VIAARNAYEGLGEESGEIELQRYRDAAEAYNRANLELREFDDVRADDAHIPVERIKTKLFASSFGTGGAIYQVMRRTLAALSIDHTAEKAIQSVQNGRRPVIVFEETGEAFVQKFIKDEYARIREEVAKYRAQRANAADIGDSDQSLQELADLLDAGTKPGDIVRDVRIPNLQDMMRELMTHLGGIKVMESSGMSLGNDETTEITSTSSEINVVANTRFEDIPGITISRAFRKLLKKLINCRLSLLCLLMRCGQNSIKQDCPWEKFREDNICWSRLIMTASGQIQHARRLSSVHAKNLM